MSLPTLPPYLYMASKLNKSYTLFLNGVNFACGAAKIFKDTDQQDVFMKSDLCQGLKSTYPIGPQSISLGERVDYYFLVKKELTSKAQNLLSKSLFTIVIGSNDIYTYLDTSTNNRSTPQQYVNSMVLTLKQQVKRLYDYGARKFVIVGIELIGCTPLERNERTDQECKADINRQSAKYNQFLISMLKNLKSELRGVNYSYFDGYSLMHNFIQNPTAYGFAEVKAACCGLGKLNADTPCLPFATYCTNRSNHDRTHPTEEAHLIFVDYILSGSFTTHLPY